MQKVECDWIWQTTAETASDLRQQNSHLDRQHDLPEIADRS